MKTESAPISIKVCFELKRFWPYGKVPVVLSKRKTAHYYNSFSTNLQ